MTWQPWQRKLEGGQHDGRNSSDRSHIFYKRCVWHGDEKSPFLGGVPRSACRVFPHLWLTQTMQTRSSLIKESDFSYFPTRGRQSLECEFSIVGKQAKKYTRIHSFCNTSKTAMLGCQMTGTNEEQENVTQNSREKVITGTQPWGTQVL